MTIKTKVWVYSIVAEPENPNGYAKFLIAGPPLTNDEQELARYIQLAKDKAGRRNSNWEIEVHSVSFDDAPPPQGQERVFSESARFIDQQNRDTVAADKAAVAQRREQVINALKARANR